MSRQTLSDGGAWVISWRGVGDSATGARSALAGYRKQFLYTLHKLVCDGARARVEGAEDLDLLDEQDNLLEVIQVKARDGDLQFSRVSSFLERTADLLNGNSSLRGRLASFGPIGPELVGAWNNDDANRKSVRSKLRAKGLSDASIDALFTAVELEQVDERQLDTEIRAQLGQLPGGGDIDTSFDLLMFWIYASAEGSLVLDRDLLQERLDRVGRYVVERGVWAREWFTNIVPILADSDVGLGRDLLEQEYREGAGARIDHIAARLDVERPALMLQIDHAFEAAPIVIVRGASGQGKSTLAYRWLHDRVHVRPSALEIREIRDRQHARELALAISAYVRLTGLELTVLHDVRPGDTNWTELLLEFAGLAGIRLLVTIREDDWRRVSVEMPVARFAEVELSFDSAEAREIHGRLHERNAAAHFYDFDDAWGRFGGGPLLEFVYLLTQPISLRQRLQQQLERLSDDEARRPGLLRLLRWTVIADAFGARLDARATAELLGLGEPGVVFRLLESEYLLRHRDGKLAGLHSVRSQILVELFAERDAGFETWLDTAAALLPALVEADRETFLLHAFSRRPEARDGLVSALADLPAATWMGVCGVVHALVWLGVARYAEQNAELVAEVQRAEGTSWYIFLYADLVDLESVTGRGPVDIFDLDSVPAQRKQQAAEWRARLSDPAPVLGFARRWLQRGLWPERPPSESADWPAAAEFLFWAGHLGVSIELDVDWARALGDVIDQLDAETLANFNYGAWRVGSNVFSEWHEQFAKRFEQEYDILTFADDGSEVRVEYQVTFEQLTAETGSNDGGTSFLNSRSVRCCEILRRLFPECDYYGAQGVGHRFAYEDAGMPHDPSYKRMPRESLVPSELSRFNGAFISVCTLRLRPATWPEWTSRILDYRGTICDGMDILTRALEGYFRARTPCNLREAGLFDPPPFTRIHGRLFDGTPPFPSCAVDEWGFTSEGNIAGKSLGVPIQQIQLGLRRHAPVRALMSDAFQHLRFFIQQARHVIELQPLMALAKDDAQRQAVQSLALANGIQTNTPKLSLHHLLTGSEKLSDLQAQFRQSFAQHVDASALERLEQRERRTYEQLISLWHEFVTSPQRVNRPKIKKEAPKAMREGFRKLRIKLRKAIAAGLPDHVRLHDLRDDLEDSPGLWLVVDSSRVDNNGIGDMLAVLAENLLAIDTEELHAFVIRSAWSKVHVVPLVNGRLASANCGRVGLDALRAYGADATVVVRPIPELALEALKLEQWTHPMLDRARSYIEHCTRIRELMVHYSESNTISERQDTYLPQLHATFAQTSVALGNTHKEMLSHLEQLISDGQDDESPSFQGVVAAVLSFDDDHGEIEDWAISTAKTQADDVIWKRALQFVSGI